MSSPRYEVGQIFINPYCKELFTIIKIDVIYKIYECQTYIYNVDFLYENILSWSHVDGNKEYIPYTKLSAIYYNVKQRPPNYD